MAEDSWVWELSNEFIGRSGVPEAEVRTAAQAGPGGHPR